jgi:prefoldin subunit 5
MAAKSSTKTQTPPEPADTQAKLREMVDELGSLEKELSPFAGKIKRIDALRTSIRGEYATQPAGESFTVEGAKFAVAIGARGHQTIVDVKALYKAIRTAAFLEIVTVTQKALAAVGAGVAAAVTREEQTGPRTLKIFERAG